MDVSRPRLTVPGPQVAPSDEVKGERITKRESRPFQFIGRQTFLLEQPRPPAMVFTSHETRITKHGVFGAEALQSFFFRHGRLSMRTVMWKSWSSFLTRRAGEVRETAGRRRYESTASATRPVRFFANHEPRLFFALGARPVAPPETAARTAAPADSSRLPCPPFPGIAHYCPVKKLPCASVSASSDLLGRPHDERCWPQVWSP